MRHLNFQDSALVSLLTAGIALVAACSSGSDPSTPSAGAATTGSGGAATAGTGSTAATSSATTSGAGGGSSAATGSTSSTAATASTTSAGTGGSGSTGAGGSGGSGPSGPSVCDGKGTRALAATEGKVDNFEGTMLNPGWSAFNDTMPKDNFKLLWEAPGALSTGHAGHYSGTGAKTPPMGGYGVGLIYNVAIDTTAMTYCVDISGFDGVTFWAKAGTAGAKVGVNFATPETNPVASNPALGGGDCILMPAGSSTTNPVCYQHPQKLVTLTTSWAQYQVTFAEATAPTGVKVHSVLQLLGFLSPDANWDFWIDEIQFYKGTAPTGPVAGADAGP
jgi:hypothetical protein